MQRGQLQNPCQLQLPVDCHGWFPLEDFLFSLTKENNTSCEDFSFLGKWNLFKTILCRSNLSPSNKLPSLISKFGQKGT